MTRPDAGDSGIRKRVGETIRALRNARKLTLADVSRATREPRIDLSQLSKIERAEVATSPEGYESIARALGVEVAVLFARSRRGRRAH
jgi:transcriptional regulator with XRE-family HTH domain